MLWHTATKSPSVVRFFFSFFFLLSAFVVLGSTFSARITNGAFITSGESPSGVNLGEINLDVNTWTRWPRQNFSPARYCHGIPQQLVQKLSNCCKGIFISITMIGTLRGYLVPIGLEFLLECGRCRYRENVFTRLPVELRPRNVATRRIKPITYASVRMT